MGYNRLSEMQLKSIWVTVKNNNKPINKEEESGNKDRRSFQFQK